MVCCGRRVRAFSVCSLDVVNMCIVSRSLCPVFFGSRFSLSRACGSTRRFLRCLNFGDL